MPKLSDYAQSERQREIAEAVEKHGGTRPAAAALGVSASTVHGSVQRMRRHAADSGFLPDHDIEHPVPEGHRLKGVSTLWDRDGKQRLRWDKTTIDERAAEEYRKGMLDALEADVTPLPATSAPPGEPGPNLSVYPTTDLHIGMSSWGPETGVSYDSTSASLEFLQAFSALTHSAETNTTALLAFMGDLLHVDNEANLTPKNKNSLDMDGTYEKAARAVCGTVVQAVNMALQKHGRVHVVILPGNHDTIGMLMLRSAMTAFYVNSGSVLVSGKAGVVDYHQHGKVLIGFHHGHTIKIPELAGVMAQDRAAAWGETTERVWFVGHKHSRTMQDFPGCRVEGLRSAAAPDAYAHRSGWRPIRELSRIDFNQEHGETRRDRVTI